MKHRTVLVGFLAILTVLVIGSACRSHGTKLELNGHELFYTDNVTEADAKKLGDYLIKTALFTGDTKSAQLDKAGATYQVRLVMQPRDRNDLQVRRDLRILTREISASVFNGVATEIHACDDQLKNCKVISLD